MKLYVSTAFLDTREAVEIAKAADDLGYHGMAVPDHVVNLETLQTPYPYTEDGSRRWGAFTDWPDPWVVIGAIALVTTRLRFVTTVYLPAMRDPYSAAKSIGTAAYLADGRLELGIGVGWCREEFELLGQQFERRGKRGLTMDGFEVITPLTDAVTPEHYARAEAGGITGIITMPWMFYSGPNASLPEKVDGMRRGRVPSSGGNSVRQRSRSSGVSCRGCGWAIA